MGGNGGTKALEMLRSLPRVCLANLRPSPGSKKPVSARSLPGVGGGRVHASLRWQGCAVGSPEGCRKVSGEAAAGPGERPGQNTRGKAKERLAPFLSFARLAAGVRG